MDDGIGGSNTLLSENEVHVIDLASKDSDGKRNIASQLHEALKTNGFVFLVNHGISQEKLQPVYTVMEKFCSLPDNVKAQYVMNPHEHVQGYIPAGKEILDNTGKTEMKHCYNIVSMAKKLPTNEIEDFQEVVGGVSEEFVELAKVLLKTIAEALDVDPDSFLNLHKGMMKERNLTLFRLLYYPPLEEDPSSNITRCGEHTDWGIFSLLTEDVDGGLEVIRDGEWKRVGHLPGAILMMVADILELWTSSSYKATKHRVVVPSETRVRTKGRHSTAFFVHPDFETALDPSVLKECKSGNKVEDSKCEAQDTKKTVFDYVLNKHITSLET